MKITYRDRSWDVSLGAKANSSYLSAIQEDTCEIPLLDYSSTRTISAEEFSYFVDLLEERPYYLSLEILCFLSIYFGCARAESGAKTMIQTIELKHRLNFRLTCPYAAFMDDELSRDLFPDFVLDNETILTPKVRAQLPRALIDKLYKNTLPLLRAALAQRTGESHVLAEFRKGVPRESEEGLSDFVRRTKILFRTLDSAGRLELKKSMEAQALRKLLQATSEPTSSKKRKIILVTTENGSKLRKQK